MANEQKSPLALSRFLTPDRILFLKGRQEKDDVLNALIDVLADVPDIGARDDIAWGIFHREALMSTGIGNGIMVPHFRLSSIDNTYMAAAIIPEGIKDGDALDSQVIRLVFMIVSGKDQKTIHVKLLSEISHLFFDGRLKAAFLAANDPKTCMNILLRAE